MKKSPAISFYLFNFYYYIMNKGIFEFRNLILGPIHFKFVDTEHNLFKFIFIILGE